MTSPLVNSLLQESSQKPPSPLSHPPPLICHQKYLSIVDSLKRIWASKGVRNVLKTLDFDTLDIQRMKFLPPTFNRDVLFKLPPIDTSGPFHMMHGIDKRHDGHAWTKTVTSNIKNDMNLTFRTSTYIGHLHYENQDYKYTSCIHCTSPVNERKWNGITVTTILVGQPTPGGSTLICKICKVPPIYAATHAAKIHYVYGAAKMTHACLHLGVHEHPVKVGKDQEIKERTHKTNIYDFGMHRNSASRGEAKELWLCRPYGPCKTLVLEIPFLDFIAPRYRTPHQLHKPPLNFNIDNQMHLRR